MWQTIIISVVILLLCFLFLAFNIVVRGKRFPATHVSQNEALRKRGIHCAQAQDYEARHRQGLYPEGKQQ